MNMEDVIALTNTNRGNGKKESLSRMYRLLEKIGNPQTNLNYVHIAGTNGKGSTAAFLSSILNEAAIKTGLFTSPHLEKMNERIRINKKDITDQDLINVTKKISIHVEDVERELDEKLYSFEILTAVALLYFAEKKCEFVVLEAGIGGRLDATNTIPTPEVAIITSIGMDHTKVLGNSLASIAREKAGIMKENGRIIYPSMAKEVESVFEQTAKEKGTKIKQVHLADIELIKMDENETQFTYKLSETLTIHLLGIHQMINAALVIEAVNVLKEKGYAIEQHHILNGLEDAKWYGRMEKINDNPVVFLDGAHNPEGVNTLKRTIQTIFPNEKITFVVGMMKDKDYMGMIEGVLPFAKEMLTISPDPYRGFDAEKVAEQIKIKDVKAKGYDDLTLLINELKDKALNTDKIVVFGSLYLIGDFRKEWVK